jgi:hypothetical protein
MPTLTGVPDDALVPEDVLVPDGEEVAEDEEEQAATASAIVASPAAPASALCLGLECMPPMSPP